jgi:hypothetical protein
MHPDEATLIEVGRIAIAAGRLDAELGALWWHLAPDHVDEVDARTAPAGKVRDKIKTLARQRLDDAHCDALLAFVDEVQSAQKRRNEVLHSRWLLRGPDAMRPVSEFFRLDEGQRAEYVARWEREAVASADWRRQPNDSLTLVDAQHLDELEDVERGLAAMSDVAVQWHFRIASMREAGKPPGWFGPVEARQSPQPIPPGAITGPAAEALLGKFLRPDESRASAKPAEGA